ncbi:hypothetical protein GIW81_00830 [Hyphomicrobium sp. xq]|uniref:Uncharacterized protein n=1 Tax=Hyphomicrobium album TaxID=2665159 RepID=A0A6I3KGT3_9HYPH|nr:hypothetical protein [Hyphomicrobium album]MTD92872.1 hypothetical protein [Hyphomicrobium album]
MKKIRRIKRRGALVPVDDYTEYANVPDLQVYENEDEYEFTGILDVEGEPLYRKTRDGIGFLRKAALRRGRKRTATRPSKGTPRAKRKPTKRR